MRIILVVIAICAALFGAERLGERRGQKWADAWYAPPVEQEAEPQGQSGPTPSLAFLQMPKDSTLHEKGFHKKHQRLMEQHKEMLVSAGRISDAEHFDASQYLGTYGWYNGICDDIGNEKPPVPCSFGAYTFSQAAFEQAKRLYVIRGQMAAGSDLLIDIGAGAFDQDVVGYDVPYLTYCELTGGKLHHCEDGLEHSRVVEFIDKHTVRLDKKAKWNAEMYGLAIRPADYVDLCNCTMSLSAPGSQPSVPATNDGTIVQY